MDKVTDRIFKHLIDMEDRIRTQVRESHDEMITFKDGIYSKMDQVMAELKTTREE